MPDVDTSYAVYPCTHRERNTYNYRARREVGISLYPQGTLQMQNNF